jgi:hypothetical protein
MATQPGKRSTITPHPMYGDLGSFSIADLPISDSIGVVAQTAIGVDTTSAAIAHGGNGIQLLAKFSDGVTTCSIDVIDAGNLAVLRTFNLVSNNNMNHLFVGPSVFDGNIALGGQTVKVRVYNFAGGGTVAITLKRTS